MKIQVKISLGAITSVIFIVIGFAVSNEFFGDVGFLGRIMIAAICGGIGGGVGALFSSRMEMRIIDVIDNILWFLLFCLPGWIIGFLVSSAYADHVTESFRNISITFITFAFSTIFTYQKIKKKRTVRNLFDNNYSNEDNGNIRNTELFEVNVKIKVEPIEESPYQIKVFINFYHKELREKVSRYLDNHSVRINVMQKHKKMLLNQENLYIDIIEDKSKNEKEIYLEDYLSNGGLYKFYEEQMAIEFRSKIRDVLTRYIKTFERSYLEAKENQEIYK